MVNIRENLIKEGITDPRILDNLPNNTDDLFIMHFNFRWRDDYQPDNEGIIMDLTENRYMLKYIYFEGRSDGLIAITPKKVVFEDREITPSQYNGKPIAVIDGKEVVMQQGVFRYKYEGDKFLLDLGNGKEMWQTFTGVKVRHVDKIDAFPKLIE